MMLALVLLLLAGAFGSRKVHFTQRYRLGDSTPHTWQARIDNFNVADQRTYAQRFYYDAQYWDTVEATGPIFLELNGEWEVTGHACCGDEVSTNAEKHGALIISLEHRFYGQSQPFSDLSVPSMRYLTSRQALADAAAFIDYVDAYLHPTTHVPGSPQNKWVVFGGSYGGALASWFRTTYPHASACAIASSGVVNAIYDFTTFDEQIRAGAGEECANALRGATKQMELMLEFGDKEGLYAMFGADSNLTLGDFFYTIADSAVMALQYGYKHALCDIMERAYNLGFDVVEAYAEYWAWYKATFNPDGFSLYDRNAMNKEVIPTDGGDMMRQWWYQTCAEVGYFQNAPAMKSIRSEAYVTETYHNGMCSFLFGLSPPDTFETNAIYGADLPQDPDVYYTNFFQDPWWRASVRDPETYKNSDFITCEDCYHCNDLGVAKESDPQELTDMRRRVGLFIDECLA